MLLLLLLLLGGDAASHQPAPVTAEWAEGLPASLQHAQAAAHSGQPHVALETLIKAQLSQ